MCDGYYHKNKLETMIARPFASVGPYLPLDWNFAIGNFLNDALNDRPISVRGDGLGRRSYLYAADQITWLWKILFDGKPGRAYNVGSKEDHSFAEIGRIVANAVNPPLSIQVVGHDKTATEADRKIDLYVPDVTRATKELGLRETFDLSSSIERTLRWHRHQARLQHVLSRR
jgi:nucleoside-diphosphate-sugar epimerase